MKNITIERLKSIKVEGNKFAVITAYDYSFAKLIDEAEIEVTLVGDSLGNVIQGQETTLPVTVDEMAYHTANVKRGISASLIVADMPFMSYASVPQALENAAILMQSGAQMVKLEGGEWLTETVHALTETSKVIEFHNHEIEALQEKIAEQNGYQLVGHSLVLYVKPKD